MDQPIYFYAKNDAYYELSNFAPYGAEIDGVYWPTVEHYFQAQKFSDPAYQEQIRQARSPKQAKDLGRSRRIPIRRDWDTVRDDIMKAALRAKFSHAKLAKLLLATGSSRLIEKSPFDAYWGCGPDGTGKNRLGQLLMDLRDELRRKA